MKKIYILLFIVALFMIKAQGQIITQSLQTELDNASPSDMISIIIKMNDQLNCEYLLDSLIFNLPRKVRRQLVVSELKSFADTSQQAIMNTLTGLEALGQVENVRQFWIVNMITCKAKPAAINQLAQRQDINMLHIDEVFEIEEIVTDSVMTPPDTAYHIKTMNVPAVWDLGYEGEGVVVAVLDTGVDIYHPDLENNIWEDGGWNIIDWNDNVDDSYGHGTSVAGVIAGDGTMGTITGVAPKAKIMALKVAFNNMSTQAYHSFFLAGIAWGLDHGADIFNISWHTIKNSTPQTLRLWRQVMDCVLEASCVTVVAAGNNKSTIKIPGMIPPPWKHPHQEIYGSEGTQSGVVCVAAIDSLGNHWHLSGFGPVSWSNVSPYEDYNYNPPNLGLRRPDLVAPGVAITSLKANSVEYVIGNGTSFSSPAVAGVMALMLSKNPFLTPAELDSIIELTAFHPDNDTTNSNPYLRFKDNFIGSGSVDAFAAIEMSPECQLIVENTQILNDTIFYCNIIVKPGGSLTINQNLWFALNRKIIVEPGGKLIVDGAKISRLNNKVWKGIEVWGNSEENQLSDTQGNYSQGYLNLKNATIENAISAVELWKPNDYTKTGGIVIANNTVFRNNKKAVHALHYTNTNPFTGLEMDYVATFTRCTFEIDNNYPGFERFSKHVDLARVKGVKFLACEFSLSPDAQNISSWNAGISAYSAGFRVDAICTSGTVPCSTYDSCIFTGFHKAIDVNKTTETNQTFYVNRAKFHENAYGIHVNGIKDFTVLRSDFYLGFNDSEEEECEGINSSASAYGIHMTGCNGFAIEENYFTKANGAPTGNYTGILCKNSKTEHDVIYRNIFNSLSYGNFAEDLNRSNPSNDNTGLEYQCNFNTGNNIDFIVTGNDPINPPQIRGSMGSMSIEAGNTFSIGVQLPDGHFKNNGTQVINYFYNTNPPVYYTPYYVIPIPNAGINTCPSNYGGGSDESTRDVVLTEDEKQEAEQAFANNLSDFNDVKALFDNLKDGGNTQALKIEIETALPSDMWVLRDELLSKSPHLSQEVLIAAADKTDVLPESILFEILLANPDELRKEELINYLENKEHPLPAYMISILRQLAGGVTYKTILQQDMAKYFAGKTQAAYMLIRSCLNDTVSDYDYLRTWLANLDNLNADMQIVASYLTEENYTSAQAMLNLIPSTRNLEGNELADYNDYKTMIEMQMVWQQQNRSIFELDSFEIALLVNIAENKTGNAALMAKGILEYAYGYHFCNCLPLDKQAAWKSTAIMPDSDVDNGLTIQAAPNPANTWVAFNFTLPVHINEAVLHITDVHGRNITSFTINTNQGHQVWDIRGVEKGVYLYTLETGTISKNGKLIIN